MPKQSRTFTKQTAAEKAKVRKTLDKLEEHVTKTQYARQNANYVKTFFRYLESTGDYEYMFGPNGEYRFEKITGKMFQEFSTVLTRTGRRTGKKIYLTKGAMLG